MGPCPDCGCIDGTNFICDDCGGRLEHHSTSWGLSQEPDTIIRTPLGVVPMFIPATKKVHPHLNVDLSLASLMARYVAEKTRDGDWGQPFLEQVLHVTGEFLAYVGNPPVLEVGRAHVHGFKQVLLEGTQESPLYGRSPTHHLARHRPPKSKATTNRYLSILSGFFKWALMAGYCDVNPCDGQRCSIKGSARGERAAFSDEEMVKIFNKGILSDSPAFGMPYFRQAALQKGLAHYWIPLIMRYSGMRPEEIAQLRYGDFSNTAAPGERATLKFDLTSPGLNIKTEAGRRLVPVHEKLREGIEELREVCQRRFKEFGHSNMPLEEYRLFPELMMKSDGVSRRAAVPSRWFNEIWLRQYCGIKDPSKVLYSLRHTAITRMAQTGHSELVIAQLVGHCPPKGETFGRYAKGCSMDQLVAAVSSLY